MNTSIEFMNKSFLGFVLKKCEKKDNMKRKIEKEKKIENLTKLLKEKDQEISTLKQKCGFFERKNAELSEKVEQQKAIK